MRESLIQLAVYVLPAALPLICIVWVAFTSFTAGLAVYRREGKTYLWIAAFLMSVTLWYGTLFALQLFGYETFKTEKLYPVILAIISVCRILLVKSLISLSSKNIQKKWIQISNILVLVSFIFSFVAFFAETKRFVYYESTVSILLFLQSALTLFVIVKDFISSKKIRKLIPGIVSWSSSWLFVAICSSFLCFKLPIPRWISSSVIIFLTITELLTAVSLVLTSMESLASSSLKELVIDEYTSKVSDSARRFIPDLFIEQLEKENFLSLKLGDHIKKEMTIFFSDIRSFTEMSENLTTEEGFAFINSYMSRVVPLIQEYGGYVDKYMGDGIMAIFPSEKGADLAVKASVEMQKKIIEYNQHRAKVGYKPISIGIGLNTGPLMLGVVGTDNRMEGTVVSDAVNLSSRLQSIAKTFNVPLVVSESTFMQLENPGDYKFRFLGKVRVKGKHKPISVFEIFDGLPQQIFDKKIKTNTFFEQGMMAYYQKEYSQAATFFSRVLEELPNDGASLFYLDICVQKTASKVQFEKLKNGLEGINIEET